MESKIINEIDIINDIDDDDNNNNQVDEVISRINMELPIPIAQYIGLLYIKQTCECGKKIEKCNFIFKDKGIVTECCDRLYYGNDYKMVNDSILRKFVKPEQLPIFRILSFIEGCAIGKKISIREHLTLYNSMFQCCISGKKSEYIVYMHMRFIFFVSGKLNSSGENIKKGIISIYKYLERYFIPGNKGKKLNGLTIKPIKEIVGDDMKK